MGRRREEKRKKRGARKAEHQAGNVGTKSIKNNLYPFGIYANSIPFFMSSNCLESLLTIDKNKTANRKFPEKNYFEKFVFVFLFLLFHVLLYFPFFGNR